MPPRALNGPRNANGDETVVLDLSDYPSGTRALGIDILAHEAHRLTALMVSMARVVEWLEPRPDLPDFVSEGLAIAGLITFCTCFEGTRGHRSRPLKAKAIFTPEQREKLKRIVAVRNKLVAHDDGLFPMNASFALFDSAGMVVEACSVSAHLHLRGYTSFEALRELASTAHAWLVEAANAEHDRLANLLRTMPIEERRAALDAAPPYVINVTKKDIPL